MKHTIKIWFSDFTENINPRDNALSKLLQKKFNLIYDHQNPDYLIFSCYGNNYLKYKNAIKIYYTGENLVPDFNLCDYAIGFHFIDFQDRYLRYPIFALHTDQSPHLIRTSTFDHRIFTNKPYFCNYIYSNGNANPCRENFYHSLSKYKKVFAPGKHLKNCNFEIGNRHNEDWMYTKLNFQSKCKFTLAFENSFCPGYTTEKIMHAFIANSIPIYWGNPAIVRDFNPDAFINCHDYDNPDQIVAKIIELDKNNTLFLNMLNQPPYKNNIIPPHLSENNLLDFFNNIFIQQKNKAYRRPQYGYVSNYENKLLDLNFPKNKLQKLKSKIRKSLS